jgi:uncharacterized protein (TIGR00730 family)
MKNLTVFCGSSYGNDTVYKEQSFALGAYLANQNIGLVYGGAKVGLMGAVAQGVLENGGEVVGVLPNFLRTKEVAHEDLTELILVETMHERKMKMHELSDGAIALAGGFGTFEELFEILTWGQLGLHEKPVGLLNTNGFYDHLILMVKTMVREGFLKESNEKMLLVETDFQLLIEDMKNYQAPKIAKWISEKQT